MPPRPRRVRRRGGPRAVPAGRSVLRAPRVHRLHVLAVLARLAMAETQLKALADLEGGRLRLGAFASANTSLLPPGCRDLDRGRASRLSRPAGGFLRGCRLRTADRVPLRRLDRQAGAGRRRAGRHALPQPGPAQRPATTSCCVRSARPCRPAASWPPWPTGPTLGAEASTAQRGVIMDGSASGTVAPRLVARSWLASASASSGGAK